MTGGRRWRILMLAPLLPWPVNNGTKVRMFHLARLLGRRHDVTLLAMSPDAAGLDRQLAAELPGVELKVVCRGRRPPTAIGAVRALFSGLPLHVSEAAEGRMAQAVRDVSTRPFDVLHVFHMTMMQYASQARPQFSVYDPMGNETLYMERMIAARPSLWTPLLRMNLARVRRYEAWAASRCDAVVSVSELEAEHFRRHARPGARVVTIPIAPDTAQLLALEPDPAERPVVLFTGSLDWFPNVDAARFLVREIWPDVRRARGDAELWLAGKDPTPEIQELGRTAGVTVIANPVSMLPLLASAAVVAAPIRTGSGTKIKTVEAMAAGKAVVATTLGCEGWDVQDGTHLRRRDTPREFAGAVVDLLDNRGERGRLGAAARALVRERYTTEGMVAEFEALYASGLFRAGAA